MRTAIETASGLYIDFRNPTIKWADGLMLRREAATLKVSRGVGKHWGQKNALASLDDIGWRPNLAGREFLRMHEELVRG